MAIAKYLQSFELLLNKCCVYHIYNVYLNIINLKDNKMRALTEIKKITKSIKSKFNKPFLVVCFFNTDRLPMIFSSHKSEVLANKTSEKYSNNSHYEGCTFEVVKNNLL
jgi:hypothetical protein